MKIFQSTTDGVIFQYAKVWQWRERGTCERQNPISRKMINYHDTNTIDGRESIIEQIFFHTRAMGSVLLSLVSLVSFRFNDDDERAARERASVARVSSTYSIMFKGFTFEFFVEYFHILVQSIEKSFYHWQLKLLLLLLWATTTTSTKAKFEKKCRCDGRAEGTE